MNIATIWGIAKVAATKIPWGRVMENIPGMVDMARDRFRGHPQQGGLEERVFELEEENRKIEQALLATSGHLEQTIKTLKVVMARQKVLMWITALSLATALAALMLALG